jgi:hypothetical protein
VSVLAWLLAADAYAGRPWAYAANQVAHAALGWLVVHALGSGLSVLLALAVAYAAWEGVQAVLGRGRQSIDDAAEDWSFVYGGAAMAAVPDAAIAVAPLIAAGLVRGIARRR